MAHERSARRVASTNASNGLPADWERDLTARFRQALSTRRMNELISRSSSTRSNSSLPSTPSRTPSYQRTSHLPPRHGSSNYLARPTSTADDFSFGAPIAPNSSLNNLPLIPQSPEDAASRQFRNQLHMLSETPCKWENPGLLDDAMKSVPLERIYNEATEESQMFQATAESIGKKPAWAFQDCVIRALVKWFKSTFFTWVNNPPCSRCGSPTIAQGHGAPTQEEKALGGNRVELYQCSLPDCGAYERFPRYNDAFVLLQTRRGRCGEWANCFSMLCRAMGSRVRWIWNSEDHVWTEVYSDYRKRWVHVDACEAVFDKPLTYNEGWGKKLAYCIGFSADGAMDVTRRYCRNPARFGLERTKCPEATLLHIVDEIRNMRRRTVPKDEKFKLEGEDMRETHELRHYYVSTVAAEVAKLMPHVRNNATPSTAPDDADAQKARERREAYQSRQSGNPEWIAARGEDGVRNDGQPNEPRDPSR